MKALEQAAFVMKVDGKWPSIPSERSMSPKSFLNARITAADPPPLKWSDLRYVFDSQEGHDGKEALQD